VLILVVVLLLQEPRSEYYKNKDTAQEVFFIHFKTFFYEKK